MRSDPLASSFNEVFMKRISFLLLGSLVFTACQNTSSLDQVLSQTYVHKYGFETTEKDWEERERDGLVVSVLKNGVKVSQSYENGKLHGSTTFTFPHSAIIERTQVYGQGILLKDQLNDSAGMPIREEIYEFDNRVLVTLWDEKGVPLSIEEYDGELLTEGKYYTADHELEASVISGMGERVKRDRSGLLISKDQIQNGVMSCRTTHHPNGGVHTISHYNNYELHGAQMKYTASGRPLMELNWKNGVLDGPKIVYRNGLRVAVIPYQDGKKQGTEFHYDDLGNLTAEIEWLEDQKHGITKLHSEEETESEWFFKGQSVSADKFRTLETRDQIASELRDHEIR